MPLTLLSEPVNRIWFLMPRPPASEASSDGVEPSEIQESNKIPFFITLSAGALSAIWFGLSLVALSIEWLLDFSVGGNRAQILGGGRRRLRHRTQEKRSLSTYETTSLYHTSQQSSVRKQTKRVSFARITTVVQSHSADYEVSSLSLASSTTIVVAPLRTDHPEIMRDAMTVSDLATPKVHDSTSRLRLPIKSRGDVSPSKAGSVGASKRQPIEDSRMNLGASDSRSPSPVERVSRRIRSLRLPSKKSCPLTALKPKRAHTIPTCTFRKVRRADPVPRTSPYGAPYFATPPAPVCEMYGGSRHFEGKNYHFPTPQ
ncbi:hypothetical protein APHAL10511_005919 [Amanita phalloides]|nr:hypothetical protein APHAL10511_005919 [Amanita phalloides]